MRPLRALAVIPLVATLLLGGAATASAQVSPPRDPVLPSLPGMPFVNVGFPCFFPGNSGAPVNQTDNIGATDDSIVVLWDAASTLPTVPGVPGFGQAGDFDFMKCFFHYAPGTEGEPRIQKDLPCDYYGNQVGHDFAHSLLIVRDEFAIWICTGTQLD